MKDDLGRRQFHRDSIVDLATRGIDRPEHGRYKRDGQSPGEIATVERRPHPTDRRGTVVVLTNDALARTRSIFEPMATSLERLLSSYSEKKLEILSDFYRRTSIFWKEERDKIPALHIEKRSGRPRRDA